MKDEDKRLMDETPDHQEWNAAVFDSARKLARSGEDVPAHAFLMLEAARQYHMSQITRLERAMTTEVLTSEEVVDLALKALRPEGTATKPKVAFCYAKGESANIAWQTGLAELGDARLVWVNEGDIIMWGEEHRVGDKPVPPMAHMLASPQDSAAK